MDRLNPAVLTRKALIRALSALKRGDKGLCSAMIELAEIQCRRIDPEIKEQQAPGGNP